MTPLKIIFAGSGEFGLPTLSAILGAHHQVVQVVSQPDKPAGRGNRLTPTPIARYAADNWLPLLRTANINHETLPSADVLVVIAFGQKIAPHVVNHARLGSVNLHASRLPKYRGAAPINWAILNGEITTGNSIIRLAQKMDAGAILGQSEVRIGELETAGELHDRLANDGAPLMLRVLDQLADGSAIETPQDESQATLAPKLNRESAVIDWTAPADKVARHIRGLHPWPGCRVALINETGNSVVRMTMVRARASAARQGSPGRIQSDLTVRCGEGSVEVVEVQPEGKRSMPLAAFCNGHPWNAGMRLEPIA